MRAHALCLRILFFSIRHTTCPAQKIHTRKKNKLTKKQTKTWEPPRPCEQCFAHALLLVHPRRAGAARVTAVCQAAAIFALYTGFGAIPTSSELREHVKQNGDFPETTAFKRYAVKNDNMHKSHQLPRPIRLLSVPCGGTRSNHEAVYRLPHRHAIL